MSDGIKITVCHHPNMIIQPGQFSAMRHCPDCMLTEEALQKATPSIGEEGLCSSCHVRKLEPATLLIRTEDWEEVLWTRNTRYCWRDYPCGQDMANVSIEHDIRRTMPKEIIEIYDNERKKQEHEFRTRAGTLDTCPCNDCHKDRWIRRRARMDTRPRNDHFELKGEKDD